MSSEKRHLFSEEQARADTDRIVAAIDRLSQAHGGDTEAAAVEYGVRWVKGASSPQLERVTRQNGVISPWNIEFTPNVGGDITDNPFDYIELFAPKLVSDAAGNIFRRFGRFYVGEQTIGNYCYIWVCKSQVNTFYRLPRAFYHKGSPHWAYVDIGVYEGGLETIGSTQYLNSKPGQALASYITRTQAQNAARAWEAKNGSKADEEFYSITTMSEITEILHPLLLIMFGTKNAQAVYNGVCEVNTDDYEAARAESNTHRVLFSLSDYSEADLREQFPVGCCVWGNILNDTWCKVTACGTVKVSNVNYFYITLDGAAFNTNVGECVCRSVNATGQTDEIKATHGTASNDGTHSFKVLGIENIYGNIWKHILDCTMSARVPYICEDLTAWTDATAPASNAAFKPCNYQVCNSGWVKELYHDNAHPDVNLPVEVGGSSETYYCDYTWTASGTYTTLFGGAYGSGSYCGPSCWNLDGSVGDYVDGLGARLSRKKALQGG